MDHQGIAAPATDGAVGPLDPLRDQAQHYATSATATATRTAYRLDWACFAGWTASHGLDARPARPETVGLYLTAMAPTLRVSTLERRLAAIAIAHRLAGHQLDTRHPAIRDVLRGIRRAHGSARRQAAAATVDLVKAMAASCDDELLGRRDQALLLLGFAGAFRRSELVALQVEDVVEEESGLRLTIRRSKGDQAGAGQVVGISRTGSATCPVAALAAWREAAAIAAGPLFRSVDRHGRIGDSLSDKAVALVVKRRAELAGLDPALFSGHSLRAGLATSAAAHGLEERDIQRQTRHRSLTVLRRYIRDGDLFRANVSGRVGL
jgi:integrase